MPRRNRKQRVSFSSSRRRRSGARSGKAPSASRRSKTRSRSSRSTGTRSQTALGLLKEDHRTVDSLFDRFERARGEADRERIAGKICEELKAHAQLEEELFYPAAREAMSDHDLLNEAQVEHDTAKDLIREIEATSPSDERYEALVTVLGEYVRHHVREEEKELFPKLRRTAIDLAELGQRMRDRKRANEKTGGLASGITSAIFGRNGSS